LIPLHVQPEGLSSISIDVMRLGLDEPILGHPVCLKHATAVLRGKAFSISSALNEICANHVSICRILVGAQGGGRNAPEQIDSRIALLS